MDSKQAEQAEQRIEELEAEVERLKFLVALLIWMKKGRRFGALRIAKKDIEELEGTARVSARRHWSGDMILGVAPASKEDDDGA